MSPMYRNSRNEVVSLIDPAAAVGLISSVLKRMADRADIGAYTALSSLDIARRLDHIRGMIANATMNRVIRYSISSLDQRTASRLMDAANQAEHATGGRSVGIVGIVTPESDTMMIGEVMRAATVLARQGLTLGLLSDHEHTALDTVTDIAALNWSNPLFRMRIADIQVPMEDELTIPVPPESTESELSMG